MNQDLEYRIAEQIGFSWEKRQIELVVMPYETEAEILYQGRVIREICSRGAWDGIERRANRIKVNRDHDASRTVGKALSLHPSRREGLVAELHVSKTLLGDETLTLAEDGVLDASAGFRPLDQPGSEVWESRDRRRLVKCFLGHIALTPDPAYETANVLAVRHAETASKSGTPVLDRILAERSAKAYGLNL